MPQYETAQSKRTLAVAQAIHRKLSKSVMASPVEIPREACVSGSPVTFLVVDKRSGHEYKVRITEYS